MFKSNNPHDIYPGEQFPKLSKAEVLFFGMIQSGSVKLDSVPIPRAGEEIDYIDFDGKAAEVLNHNAMILSDLYEYCRRFAARSEQSAH